METIGSRSIVSYYADSSEPEIASNTKIRKGPGHTVHNFFELAKKIAELQFLNRDYVLLFRGQHVDHKNKQGNTSLKPTIFRDAFGGNSSRDTLFNRFQLLANAESRLVHRYQEEKLLGVQRLRRHNLLRWAILQHYNVCDTPLLDVTHSLRIGASFASKVGHPTAFLFVLGVPHLSGAITASSEAGLQIVRLASACPPSAVRPHLQEGYLLGEYPEIGNSDQKSLYDHYEVDFGLRLVAKFRFDSNTFWSSTTFPKIEDKALYPTERRDPLSVMCEEIRANLA